MCLFLVMTRQITSNKMHRDSDTHSDIWQCVRRAMRVDGI